MLLKEYVRKNWVYVKMKYGHAIQEDSRHDWAGMHTHYPRLWEKGQESRLYVPMGMLVTAGYIDLNRQTYSVQITVGKFKRSDPALEERADTLLRSVLAELQESAVSEISG